MCYRPNGSAGNPFTLTYLVTLPYQLKFRVFLLENIKYVCAQVRGPEGDPRGLLWVLDEELVTPNSSENTVLERICHYFGDTGT